MDDPQDERWIQEKLFFDRVASAFQPEPIDPLAVARYSGPGLRRIFSKEFRFRLLGNLEGKHVLDAGCGTGGNSILMAKLGATVTAVDISSRSIEIARRRAVVDGVAGLTEFRCAPLELADLPEGAFDVIWCDNVLHHMISSLAPVLQLFSRWGKPGALVVLAEPVNLCRSLRRLRLMMPISTDATPSERPLERAEIEILRRHLLDPKIRLFALLGRLDRFILIGRGYERSPASRRALSWALACADHALLSLPAFKTMGGRAVIYGYTARSLQKMPQVPAGTRTPISSPSPEK